MNNIPKLNQWLHDTRAELLDDGYKNFFIVVVDPEHPLGGSSITNLSGCTPDRELIQQLRSEMIRWEIDKGFDPYHDWSKLLSYQPEVHEDR